MKFIGLFLIFVCCTAGGMALAGGVSRSLSLCEGMLAFVRHIRSRVSYYKAPVGEICTSFQNEAFRRAGLDGLIAERGFPKALEMERGALSLEEDAYQALLSFAKRLGSLSYDEQIADCDYVGEVLEAAIEQKRESIPAKRQIYSSMGILGGAMAVLILI
ncbi:MAG: stage III sporulation protein AB [Clostridia bacterium]|nr:stage III sporulation protein AB [Clostridia bacterium]